MSFWRRRRDHLYTAGIPFVLNSQPLTKWRTDRATVTGGTGRARVIFAGDSSPASYGSDNVGNFTAIHACDARLARQFTQEGLPSTYSSLFGGHGAVSLSNWDFRANQGTWPYEAPGTYGITVGGEFFLTSGTPIATYTPQDDTTTSIATDTCDIWYAQDPSQGTINKQVDSGGLTPVVQTGVSQVMKTTLSTTLGAHTYKAIGVAGSSNFIGFHCYNSAVKAVDFWNMGCVGSFATQWSQTTFSWNPPNTWAALTPSIVFFSVGANDFLGGSSIATITPLLTASVNAIKSTGANVVILGYNPVKLTSLTAQQQNDLRDMMYAVSLATSCTFIDVLNMMGGASAFAANNSAGLMFDDLHRNFAGYTATVKACHDLLAR